MRFAGLPEASAGRLSPIDGVCWTSEGESIAMESGAGSEAVIGDGDGSGTMLADGVGVTVRGAVSTGTADVAHDWRAAVYRSSQAAHSLFERDRKYVAPESNALLRSSTSSRVVMWLGLTNLFSGHFSRTTPYLAVTFPSKSR